ncbi:MAG TPA: hypothetical protein VGP62_07220 [Bryobacteraceae bacterium]|jgi:hypothetical protein|nr:hypothetical protein [Bryobacteraceae bacterium]
MSNVSCITVAHGDGIGPEIALLEVVKTETLRNFDGQAGYTLAQGQ